MIKSIDPPLSISIFDGDSKQNKVEKAALMAAILDQGYNVVREDLKTNVEAFDNQIVKVVINKCEDQHHLKDEILEWKVGDVFTAILDGLSQQKVEKKVNQPGRWKPWFPVIDYDRCTNCMQCLSFCLFDVYGVSQDGKIQVQNNDHCKTNCPACSRVCPEVAIMFPKYHAAPINGDIIQANDLNREKIKVDISSLLGGDLYSTLRVRSEKNKSRFSKERSSDKALEERKKCLTKMVDDGFIPHDVLASLPSAHEILEKAEMAKKKAQEALKMNENSKLIVKDE
jgi:Pyruvate/2-oxoacid:ferredoxin oxidoreductase delta subunit